MDAQLLLNALALGSAYALVALGFVLVANATAAINFAQGDAVVAGGLAAVALAPYLPASAVPGLLLLPLILLLAAALGLLISALAWRLLVSGPSAALLVATLALGTLMGSGANALLGAAPRAAPPLVAGPPLDWAGLALPRQALALILVALALSLVLGLMLARTQLGRRLRAVAADRELAATLGIAPGPMIALAFALGTALAGAAGLMLAHQFYVAPTDGPGLMLKAYIAATLGGFGSFGGAVLGALLVALFEVFVAAYLSAPLAQGALLAALFAMLLLRPQGLIGRPPPREA